MKYADDTARGVRLAADVALVAATHAPDSAQAEAAVSHVDAAVEMLAGVPLGWRGRRELHAARKALIRAHRKLDQ